jgi:hypothetical protein
MGRITAIANPQDCEQQKLLNGILPAALAKSLVCEMSCVWVSPIINISRKNATISSVQEQFTKRINNSISRKVDKLAREGRFGTGQILAQKRQAIKDPTKPGRSF